jgi:hypothetical protein
LNIRGLNCKRLVVCGAFFIFFPYFIFYSSLHRYSDESTIEFAWDSQI